MKSRVALLRNIGAGLAGLVAIGITPVFAAGCTLGVMANFPVTMNGLRVSVPVKINGKDTQFWVDSGAFFSIMSEAKAAEFQLKLQPPPAGFYMIGVGGSATTKIATVKGFGIAGQEIKNVQFLVGGSDAGNGLIGRNLLALGDTEFDLANGSIKLINARGCDKGAPAYWAPDKPYFTVPLDAGTTQERIFQLSVGINDVKITAIMDSGAPTSMISRSAAEKAGIDLNGAGVTRLHDLGGFGRRLTGGWSAPVAKVTIGNEQILKTHLTVIDGPIISAEHGPDMLLGADFMLAHHIYFARRQGQIYFTYSGGKPFLSYSAARDKPASESGRDSLPAGTRRVEAVTLASEQPKTAAEYARRGNARLTQRLFAGSIADLSEAIRLSPETASYFRDRGEAYVQHGQRALARADLEKALKLDPTNGNSLQTRAYLRLDEGDKVGALADAEAAAKVTPPASLEAVSLAIMFERLDQPLRAIPILDAVIAVHREDSRLGELLNARCWQRGLANVDLDKAMDDCNRAIKRDGPKAGYLDSRGLIFYRKDNFAAAIGDYNAALKSDPKLAWSLYLRGFAKTALGQNESGKADLAAAILAQSDIAHEAGRFGIGPKQQEKPATTS
jgi:tetratricopeptide (TPR) repeat protein/predicted aspartyl protease